MNSRLVRTLIFLGILTTGTLITLYMVSNPVTPDRVPAEEHITPVNVTVLKHISEQVKITGYGTVTPAREVRIQPEVMGRITEMNSKLMPGGYFPKGAMMVRIDSRDYQAQYEAMKNQVAQATLQLKQEKARQSVARQEWDLLGTNIPEDEANRELALRIPQIESAEAALAAAKSALARAGLDLDRCTVRAPFNAMVLRENVDPGQVVNSQTEIAALAGTDQYWVKVSVPVEYLPWVIILKEGDKGSDAIVIQKAGSKNLTRKGHVVRLLGDLDPNGRLARLLVAVDDPLNLKNNRDKLPLLLGSYVTVEIAGKTMDDVVPVPRSAVRDMNGDSGLDSRKSEGIWIMDKEDRLQIEPVTVVWRMPDSVFVSTGLSDGMRLVTSSIATPMRGMKLSVQEDDKVTTNIVSTEE